ncbi:MAG: ABC transporter permease [Cyclobacteriaceae bacterium]|nr:ABC transporter permease [Cyclobacteriaceae bacterium]
MLKNYIKIAIRNLTRNSLYSLINIIGLAIGLACFVLIAIYVKNETGYDRFYTNAENIYRLNTHVDVNGVQNRYSMAHYPASFDMVEEFPEVEAAATIFKPFFFSNLLPTIKYEDNEYQERKFYLADSSLFSIFDFDFKYGNREKAFENSNSVVLSHEAAKKYFGETNPLGKLITFQDTVSFKVTGVLEPFRGKTHLDFDFLAHSKLLINQLVGFRIDHDYRGMWYYSYVVLKPGSDPNQTNAKLPAFVASHYLPRYTENNAALKLQSIQDIHLKSDFSNADMSVNGNIQYVYILSSIAILVLIIACINFMNLSIARYSNRGKEVGIRKVMGAQKKNLVFQFLGESLLIALISGIISFFIIWIALPIFNDLASTQIDSKELLNPSNIVAAALVTLFAGLIAGLYPSFVMASFQPVKVLKGLHKAVNRKIDLRKGLVVGQFTVSLILLIGTLIISDQLDFMRNKDMGFNKEEVIVVRAIGTGMPPNYATFKERLLRESGVISVTNLSHDMGQKNLPYFPMIVEGVEDEQMLPIMSAGYDFLETFGLEMEEGRYFDIEHPSDSTLAVVINEATARAFNWEDPIGRKITFGEGGNPNITVIGVIEDFNFDPLRNKVSPVIISFAPAFSNIAIKIKSGDYRTTVAHIENTWNDIIQDNPFSFYFLDEALNQTYASEERLAKIFKTFSGLAIFVACLGLFALASFSAQRRLKEIGVRKVLGATEPSLVLLMYKEFLILVVVAAVLASPLSYYLFDGWLDSFAYRIQINPIVFLMALALLTIIAFITVGYQSLNAARSNPTQTLRSE